MKAIQLEKPECFRMIETANPSDPGPGEVLVRIQRVGICGTDYSGYLGKMPFYSYPRIPGHELGVEVLEVGREVTQVAAGDRCAVEPYMNCQSCGACRKGQGNCCENLKVLGVMMDGGLCERMILPARKLHPSNTLAPEQLALVETLAIGCHAVNRGQARTGETVLVIGAGPIGLAALEFVKLSGTRAIVMDVNRRRLEFCRAQMGVEEVLELRSEDAVLEELRGLTGGQLADLVIDATGNPQSMSNALQYAGFTGRVVYVGITTAEIRFTHPLMHRRELTLYASRNALPADFHRIVQLIEAGRIDTRPWITHQAAFGAMIAEFPGWLKPEAGVVKAMVSVS